MKQSLVFLLPLLVLCSANSYEDYDTDTDTLFDSIEWPEVPEEFNLNNRIIGGEYALQGQFPYQVGLLMNKSGAGSWCGGVLISDSYVLTAAHCANAATFINVYLGAQAIRNLTEDGRINLIVEAKDIVVHPQYNQQRISDDIAILKLPRKIQTTDKIKPIALPTRTDATKSFADKKAIASGWGRPSDSVNGISEKLRFTIVEVQPETICKHFFGTLILPSNVCTDTGLGKGICNGDSGGPVAITKSDGTPMILGLSSFVSSIACVNAGFPSVFVRVSYYLDWIAQHSDIKIEN